MASPKKLSHIVLQTNRRREMIDWYCTVLGAEILYEAERISFISYDDEHHRVAFLDPGPLAEREPDGPRAGKEAGLHHVAFTFGGLDDLTDNYLRLKEIGISPHRCVNHGVTTSMYYFDPDHPILHRGGDSRIEAAGQVSDRPETAPLSSIPR